MKGLGDDRSLASMEGYSSDHDQLTRIVNDTLRPLARAIDKDGVYPKEALKQIAQSGAFRPLQDRRHVDLLPTVRAASEVATACAATAFLMWCQSALIWYLRNTKNDYLRDTYLAPVVSGEILGGTGLSNPMKSFFGLEKLKLRGKIEDSGLRLRGVVPWVSNVENGHPFGVVFAMPDGTSQMALLRGEDSPLEKNIRLRGNDRFAVLQGTATVTAKVDTLIGQRDLLATDADDFLPCIRSGFVILQMGIGLGLIAESCRLIKSSRRPSSYRRQSRVLASLDELQAEEVALWQRVEEMTKAYKQGQEPTLIDLFRLRLDLAEAALDATTVAQLYLGASGLVADSRVERLRREAAFFGVLTPSVRHLSVVLDRLQNS